MPKGSQLPREGKNYSTDDRVNHNRPYSTSLSGSNTNHESLPQRSKDKEIHKHPTIKPSRPVGKHTEPENANASVRSHSPHASAEPDLSKTNTSPASIIVKQAECKARCMNPLGQDLELQADDEPLAAVHQFYRRTTNNFFEWQLAPHGRCKQAESISKLKISENGSHYVSAEQQPLELRQTLDYVPLCDDHGLDFLYGVGDGKKSSDATSTDASHSQCA